MTKTLGEILDETLVNANAMEACLSSMTDFERSVMENIFDFGKEAFGLNRHELITDGVIEPITRRYWASKLN
tara:strand:+ start:2990 stop:3205 length:216 start_codon:yes stop_codon:yes gene_type:complete